MNRSKRTLLVAAAALVALTVAPAASAQQWKPTKPITIIVPWAAGGSTDQVTRVAAAEIEKALDQKVIVVNQPGASVRPLLNLDMRLGEGSGAVLAFHLIEAAARILNEMATFESAGVSQKE